MEIIKIASLSLNYDIETDALYLEGFEAGFKIGFEIGFQVGVELALKKGSEQYKYEITARLLRSGDFKKETIALVAGADIAFVLQVEQDLLKDGNN